jgi:hypothetical protein
VTGTPDGLRISDASIRLDSMPSDGREVRLTVNEEERAELASRLALTSVDRLEIKLHAVKFRGGIRVTGRLEGDIVQPSVVSLEPVKQSISEPIDRIFLPGGEKEYAGAAGAEVFVDLEGEDVPDHFEGTEADLSDLMIETLSLAVDPYPRAEGESLEDIGIVDEAAGEVSPFAALKKLKTEPGAGS